MPAGVSVVIPSYRGAGAADRTLSSLDAQTLDPSRFEVVLVANGPSAVDVEAFETVRRRHDRLNVRLVASRLAGASLAWNLGVQSARMEWLTFLDDDDAVTPTFLGALLEVAEPGVVPLAPIHDVDENGRVDTTSRLNSLVTSRAGTTVAAAAIPHALGFNASKLIPTSWAQGAAYDRRMTNGQDVAYFATLSLQHDIVFAVVREDTAAAYLRGLSDMSMSRQAASFGFSIDQRLHVIERIDRVRRRAPRRRRPVADHLIRAQVHLMNRYVVDHPEHRADALSAVAGRRLAWFPYGDLNRDLATRLVVVDDAPAAPWRAVTRLRQVIAEFDEPIDVLAVAPTRQPRSWVADFWADADPDVAVREGRRFDATPSEARARLAELDGPRSPYRQIVHLERRRTLQGRGV